MPVWQAALLLNLTFAIGLGLGYAGWGRRAEALNREFEGARVKLERLERERAACAAAAGIGTQQQWDGRGVVRAVYPQLLVITHEEIPSLLPARTTSFRVTVPKLRDSIQVGDAIRFSLRGTLLDDVTLVAIEKW
jgi:hypothetical protein